VAAVGLFGSSGEEIAAATDDLGVVEGEAEVVCAGRGEFSAETEPEGVEGLDLIMGALWALRSKLATCSSSDMLVFLDEDTDLSLLYNLQTRNTG